MKKAIFALLLLPLSLFAQDATPPTPDNGLYQTLVMVAIALMFFYFILWRPEQKRRKAMEEQRNALKVGDKVTAMGIVGTIAKIEDQTVILKMVDGNKIEFLKGAISEVISAKDETKKDGS